MDTTNPTAPSAETARLTAADAYRILRARVGPFLRARGFRNVSPYLSYEQRGPAGCCRVRWQCHHAGWDRYRGGRFTVYAWRSDQDGLEPATHARLTASLSLPELEFIRARQNRVIAGLPRPPPAYVEAVIKGFEKSFRDPAPYVSLFLSDFAPLTRPYSGLDDIWFRFATRGELESWAALLLPYLNRRLRALGA